MRRLTRALRLLAALSIQFALGVLCLHLLDRAVGSIWPEGLCLPPGYRFVARTTEFSFEARTNDLGFRDSSERWSQTAQPLIAAIGDSFTYGWGVAEAEAWPRVMERQLGGFARVANLGVAGGLPHSYAEVVGKAIPRLRPDLIIVAVLQGDDLAQPAQEPPFLDRRGAMRKLVADGFRRVAPNIVQIRRNRSASEIRTTSPDQLRSRWREDVGGVLNGLTRKGREQYESLEMDVRSRYEGGDLNPWLLWCSTQVPDYYLLTLDLGAPRASSLVKTMTSDLQRIGDVCRKNGVPIVVVSVPHGMYNNGAAYRGTQRVGFLVSPAMLESTGPDVAISRSAQSANLPFISVSDVFRAHRGEPGLYFELDGHFTAEGHRLFAKALVPMVKSHLMSARAGYSSDASRHTSLR